MATPRPQRGRSVIGDLPGAPSWVCGDPPKLLRGQSDRFRRDRQRFPRFAHAGERASGRTSASRSPGEAREDGSFSVRKMPIISSLVSQAVILSGAQVRGNPQKYPKAGPCVAENTHTMCEQGFQRNPDFYIKRLEARAARFFRIGGGFIGFEFAHVSARAGAQVTLLHRSAREQGRKFETHFETTSAWYSSKRIGVSKCQLSPRWFRRQSS